MEKVTLMQNKKKHDEKIIWNAVEVTQKSRLNPLPF